MEVTSSQTETKAPPRRPPVECSRGHWNEPYPDKGKCTTCGVYLPANADAWTSEQIAALNRSRAEGGKEREKIARGVLEDEGMPWDDAPEGLRQLSLEFARTRTVKIYELILQQLSSLKARPKSSESVAEVKHEVSLTAGNVGELKASLATLDEMLNTEK